MQPIILEQHLNTEHIRKALTKHCQNRSLRKVLLIPPDITRTHSGGGIITGLYYEILTAQGAHVDILPALGTHKPMARTEQLSFFGDIPEDRFLVHRWRDGVTTLGEIPQNIVAEISEGILSEAIPVQVSDYLADTSYDLLISIGQVAPHEVVGIANYTKNIVVGCGGSKFINASHVLGAFYGIEKILGKVDTPVRRLFDYAQEHFISKLPLEYVLTVTDMGQVMGLYIGKEREIFLRAAALSQRLNITYVGTPIQNCVVYLDESEFHSTWLGNKAVYRTRMAMADGGNLLIIAPGVKMFGEDPQNDRLIRKYGYSGLDNIVRLSKTEPDLNSSLSAAAHLIHGSTDGRFTVTYAAPLLGREAIESVGYRYMEWDEAAEILVKLSPGLNP
ncbi:MAG: lactate racemase domain-containing protein, partial [Firmicutes bacterium]|nr:lactate racemase domain-containing protein [Bacillota bacterium]